MRRTFLLRKEQWFAIIITEWRVINVFLGLPIWSVAERDRATLIAIGLAKMLWAYWCYCGGRVLIWKWEKEGKVWPFFFNNTPKGEDILEIALGRRFILNGIIERLIVSERCRLEIFELKLTFMVKQWDG